MCCTCVTVCFVFALWLCVNKLMFSFVDVIGTAHTLKCVPLHCMSVPGLLSDGSWQTSPTGCCVHPVLQRRPSTPAPAGLRSAGSAGRRSDPTPGVGSLLTWFDWCSHTHSVFKKRQSRSALGLKYQLKVIVFNSIKCLIIIIDWFHFP